jgi:transcription factor TFIIIB component B''
MSSLLKKKGALTFKPKAPQPRRPAGATPGASSARPGVDRPQSQTQSQSQTPAPPAQIHDPAPPIPVPAVVPENEPPPVEKDASVGAIPENNQASVAQTIVDDNATTIKPVQEATPQSTIEPQLPVLNAVGDRPRAVSPGAASPTPTKKDPKIVKRQPPTPRHKRVSFAVERRRVDEHEELPLSLPGHADEVPVPSELPPLPGVDEGHSSIIFQDGDSSILSPERGAARDIASLLNSHALGRSPQKTASRPIPKSKSKPAPRRPVVAPRSIPTGQLPTPGATQDSQSSPPPTDDVDLSRLGAGQASRPSEIVPEVPLNADGTSAVAPILDTNDNIERSPKRQRITGGPDDVRPTIESQPIKPKRVRGPAKNPRKKRAPEDPNAEPKKRKKRAETPSDAEDQEIDQAAMKMADLCKDIKIGKKFSRHDEIKQRELERKAKAKLGLGFEAGESSNTGTPQPQAGPGTSEPAPIINTGGGPRMRIVDGQIVIDDSSLVVDRHKRAAAEALVLEEIEENDFTRITTSGSFMKKEKSQNWDLEELGRFYDGLRMFGTDFQMISKMFPNRSRKQIKLKFNKEEKMFPKKIAAVLVGEKVPIDFESYSALTGITYEEVADIESETAKIQAEHDAQQKAVDDEAAEVTRQKKAAIQGRTGDASGMESSKENYETGGGFDAGKIGAGRSKGKAGAKKKKNMHSVGGGGEEVEVLGTI